MKKGDLFGGNKGSGPADDGGKQDAQEAMDELDDIAKSMDQLRALYELYFMGVERTEPVHAKDRMRRRIRDLRDQKHRNSRVKFKLQMMQARMISLENYWGRINRQREAGTYFRDKAHVTRLKKKNAEQEAEAKRLRAIADGHAPASDVATTLSGKAPPEGQPIPEGQLQDGRHLSETAPRIPAASIPARSGSVSRPSARSVEDLTEPKLRQLYSAYSTAKRRCGERVDLRFEDMAASLKKQVPKLLASTGAKSIEFKVVIKQGRTVLKAVPKD